jgi:hypothetical protein
MKDRGIRRKNLARVKARVKKIYKDIWKFPESLITSRRIGKEAAVHMRGCACPVCQDNNTRPKEKWPKIYE